MNSIIFTAVIVAILGVVLIEANPQRVHYKTLPYHPPPKKTQRPIRVRRHDAVVGGQLSSNPNGGADARLEIAKAIGTPDHNLIGSAFAAGNTDRGPVATGGTLAYNNNGLGASVSQQHIPGVRDTLTQSATANLFNNGVHKLDAKAFASQNTNANGFKFDRNGGGLEYSHINGHGASLTHSNFPGIGQQLELGGKANLWSSPDRNTRLDLTGGASKWTSGVLSGQRDFNAGLGLTHMFG